MARRLLNIFTESRRKFLNLLKEYVIITIG